MRKHVIKLSDTKHVMKRVPFPLLPKGLSVVYRQDKIEWSGPSGQTEERERWLAILMRKQGEDRIPLVFGASIRNPIDHPDGKVGKAIALHRALHAYRENDERPCLYGQVVDWGVNYGAEKHA